MTEINKNCNIINNSDTEVMVLDVANIDDPATVGTLYELPLTLLPTNDGQSTIDSGETKTVELNDTFIDPTTQQTLDRTFYNLILTSPCTLFPIKNSYAALNVDTESYPDLNVATQDSDQTQLAYQFYQTILANPTANQTINLVNAIYQIINTADSVSDIDGIMSDYFQQNTTLYQTLDLNSLAAVVSYMEMYTCVWAANQSSYVYYLYAASPAVINSPTLAQKLTSQAPNDMGRLVFTKKMVTGDTADPNDYNSAYDISFQPADGSAAIGLTYDQGQFVSSTSDAIPAICLQATFIMQSHLSLVEADTQLILMMVGTVNGQYVVGVNTDQSDAGTGWYSFWHPSTLVGMSMGTLGIIIGVIVGLVILIGVVWQLKIKFLESEDLILTPAELDLVRERAKQMMAQEEAAAQARTDRWGISIKVKTGQEGLLQAINETTVNERIRLLRQQSDQEAMQLVNQKEQVDILANYANDSETSSLYTQIDDLLEDLKESNTALDQALDSKDSGRIESSVEKLQTLINTNHEESIPALTQSIDTLKTQYVAQLKADQLEAYTNKENAIAASEELEQTEAEIQDDVERRDVPDDTVPDYESFA